MTVMNKFLWAGLVMVVGTCLIEGGTAHAQSIGWGDTGINNYINSRPTVSPYLQLLNSNGGINGNAGAYQQYVRPAIEARQSAQYQQDEINRLRRQATTTAQSVNNLQQQAQTGIRATGHETRFMNYSRFYPTLRAGGMQR